LTSVQLGSLTTEQVVALESTHIAALTSSQIVGLSSTQIQAIQTTDIVALTTGSLSAIKTQWGSSLPYSSDQVTAMLEADIQYSRITPLVLDLDKNGISTVSVRQGIRFDHDGDGLSDETGWVSSGDGLLVRDLNGDGSISSGRELFGAFTDVSEGSRARDGYEALRDLDRNRDGFIDINDEGFSSLLVWRDSNQDGLTDDNELHSLEEFGIVRIGTSPTVDGRVNNGNVVGLSSDVLTSDGSTIQMADVWFQAVLTDENALVEALDETLARYVAQDASESSLEGSNIAEPDLSNAIVGELLSFDHAGSRVEVSGGTSSAAFSVPQIGDTDPEDLLKRQNQGVLSGSLGQT